MCKNANDFFNFYNILKFMVLLKKLEIVCFSSLYLKKNKIKNKNKTPWVFSIIVEVGGGGSLPLDKDFPLVWHLREFQA